MQGCRIDAAWRSRIAHLGTISYAFEVHRKGSRDDRGSERTGPHGAVIIHAPGCQVKRLRRRRPGGPPPIDRRPKV